ncbi:hypothetical protein Q8A73_022420 [Channa argus]|nr:hypothetical protein Q8A73_022420 [Channa argus]
MSHGVSHVFRLSGNGQFKSTSFPREYVTEMRCTVDSSRLYPRRLRFPAPLFSLGGGLSHREAVLNQQPHSSRRCGEKLVFAVADAALRFWSREDPCANVGLLQQQ